MPVSWPKAILLDLDDTIISFDHGVDLDRCWLHAIRTHLPGVRDDAAGEMVAAIKARAAWYWSDPDRHRIGRRDLIAARQEIISAALTKWDIQDPPLQPGRAFRLHLDRRRRGNRQTGRRNLSPCAGQARRIRGRRLDDRGQLRMGGCRASASGDQRDLDRP